jgi:predicted enzyme related to lactoylglutathione lyase
MSLQLANITFDCDDPLATARFWSEALGRPVDPESSEYFAMVGHTDGGATSWFFAKVPEAKTAKNRCHVDLAAESREAVATEIARLTALGATVIWDPKEEFGHYWATLRDPEGNEFCIGAD